MTDEKQNIAIRTVGFVFSVFAFVFVFFLLFCVQAFPGRFFLFGG